MPRGMRQKSAVAFGGVLISDRDVMVRVDVDVGSSRFFAVVWKQVLLVVQSGWSDTGEVF